LVVPLFCHIFLNVGLVSEGVPECALACTGGAIFLDFSNHFLPACDNDLVTVFHGDFSVTRARRDVKRGAFVTRSSHTHPLERTKAERGGVFEVNPLGKCECRACKETWPQPLRTGALIPGFHCVDDLKKLDAKVIKCPKCGSILGEEMDNVEDRRHGVCGKNG
jgi:hypothetical protein